MTEMTVLDQAHAAMDAAPEDDRARLRFYERVADSELFLLLEGEAEGDNVEPRLFPVEDGQFALAFDRVERLLTFTGQTAAYVALSGRVLAGLLAEQGIGLGLNLGVAPSSFLMPADALKWLVEMTELAPQSDQRKPVELSAPSTIPEDFLRSLDAKLALMQGYASEALLVSVRYDDGEKGHLLGIVGALPEAHDALASAVGETLRFSGIDAANLDVAFFDANTEMVSRLRAVGLRFDIPEPERAKVTIHRAPGSDPDKPPKLR
ncbi:SseB family protein [Qingshengfaniella alkalisoli]|uniref:SseB family protein n=1 Tax=Qingshengfaniella alkalisoli TaxID=2599296 RepID=A0A5B8I7B0_9RHOB|nr:SseB family protein [Qingshengfaniella alkalisoli]QDY69615.1 SseB family protein [Qingshengfaniella alkalisoli]